MVDYEKLVTSQSGNQSTLAKEPGQAREEDPVERGNRLLGMVEILNEAFGGKDLRKKGNQVTSQPGDQEREDGHAR